MPIMNLILQRFSDNGKSTMGLLFHKEDDMKFLDFILEDEHRDEKVSKETRIPAGYYELQIRKEDTPLTIKHRIAYGQWFKFHIEITKIPNFAGVYLHAGNDEKHTDGCPLIGNTLSNHNIITHDQLVSSIDGTRRVYELVYTHLESGHKAFIEIRDEHFLLGK